MARRILPPVARLRELLNYDPDNGLLSWKPRAGNRPCPQWIAWFNTHRAGQQVGSPGPCGHITVIIDRKIYMAHRIIYKMMTGKEPPEYLDHINCVPNDNRWRNLRAATSAQNRMNTKARRDNQLSTKGVYSRKLVRGLCYIASIGWNGRTKHLGVFETLSEAKAARLAAEKIMHGEFSRSS